MTRPHLRNLTLAAATLALLLAALLRIYHLTHQSLWFDEAFAWNIIRQPDMFPRIAADTHPPLYYLFLRGWTALAGESVLALRYLSVLAGMLTVAVTYRIAAALVTLRRWEPLRLWVPVMAALLVALADSEIDLAQEARSYTFYTLFAALSMWAYLRWWRAQDPLRRSPSATATSPVDEGGQESVVARRPDSRQPSAPGEAKTPLSVYGEGEANRRFAGGGVRFWLLAWIIATVALVHTHYYGLFIPAVQGICVLLCLRGRQRLHGIGALAAAGVICLPWFLGVTLDQARNAVENSLPFAVPSNAATFLELRRNFLTEQWALVLALIAAGSVIVSFNGRWRVRLAPFAPVLLVLLWIVVPVGVLWFGNYAADLLTDRKLVLIAPALALMTAFGLANLRRPAAGLLLLALIVYGLTHVDFYRLKEPWDAIAADAAQYAGPNDVALIEVGNGQYPMTYYWERTLPESALITGFPVLGDPTMAPTTDWFTFYDGLVPQLLDFNQAERIGPVATVWLAHWWHEQPSIERLEAAGYTRTMTTIHPHLGNDIALYRYDHLPDDPAMTYDSGMALRAVEIDAADARIDLWWTADAPLTAEYVTSVLLLDESGAVVAQLDSPPFYGQRPTTTWTPGATIYDPKPLDDVPPGTYTVAVQVYRFVNGEIAQSLTAAGERWYRAGTLTR